MNSNLKRLVSMILVLLAIFFAAKRCHGPESGAQLKREAYLWQRDWNAVVRESLCAEASRFADIVVLAGEVSWVSGEMKTERVGIHYATLREKGIQAGLAMRIGPFKGDGKDAAIVSKTLVSLAEALIKSASAANVPVREFQIDYDCPESKLSDYVIWLKAIGERISPTPLTITALPSWLEKAEFREVLKATRGFVLQVHSVEKPSSLQTPLTLCDPRKAMKWIRRSDRFGVPFRVALPTYSYSFMFDKKGEYVGLAAENFSPKSDKDNQVRIIDSDPDSLSALINTLNRSRYQNLDGIIWYRLPVRSDRMNWPWETLTAVMEGRRPVKGTFVSAHYPEPGLADIIVENTGETWVEPPNKILLSWENSSFQFADGVHGYIWKLESDKTGYLSLRQKDAAGRIRPGESIVCGWVRVGGNAGIKAEIELSP